MQPHQDEMFHEDFRESLRHSVNAIGGPKKVGMLLWPSLSVDQARTRLNNCLDPSRAEKLDYHEIIFIVAEARKIGVHSAATQFARETGYADPKPIEPVDEAAELQRQFIQSVQTQERILKRMEKLSLPTMQGLHAI